MLRMLRERVEAMSAHGQFAALVLPVWAAGVAVVTALVALGWFG